MNGGRRPGAGRKSKAEELKLIEKLSPMESIALEKLHAGVTKGDFQYLKLWFEYYFGKPTESINVDLEGDVETVVTLDPSKLSDAAIRELLNARRGKDTPDGIS